MNLITPGLPVHHQLLEFTQTHVHWVSDTIQPSHPLLSPSPSALNLSQHQGLFQWVSSSHQVAKVLEFQLQHQSFQWTPKDWSPLGWTGWISLQSKGLSRIFSNKKTNLTPYWICSLAITLVLYCLCLVMLVLYLLLKNVAYSMKYTRQSILEALTIKGILFYSYRDKKLQSRG